MVTSMNVFIAFAALALSAGAQDAPPIVDQGTCQGVDDDCIEGYTSLLQEDVNLVKVKHGHSLDSQRQKIALAQQTAKVPAYVWSIIGLAVLAFAVYFFMVPRGVASARPGGRRSSVLGAMMVAEDGEDVQKRDPDMMEEDAYSLAVALIIRDLAALAEGGKKHNRPLKMTRIAFAIGLIALTVCMQVFILLGTKAYVTPQQVAAIRNDYADYQVAMYNGHTVLNANGKERGIPGYFNASAFDDLSGDLQEAVCNIPMSQMGFLWLILVVWSITCMAQIKKSFENFMALVFFAETIDSMANALTDQDDEDDDDDDPEDCDDGIPIQVITGCTLTVKIFLTLCVYLPDIATTSYLLWLGSRWLVATNDFGNLISNAVALEFVLMLKDLLFMALVTDRNKRDLAHTALAPSWDKEPAGYGIYFNALVWAVLAVLWVWVYINNQGVLLDYKYDVHTVCNTWLQNQLNPDYDSGSD